MIKHKEIILVRVMGENRESLLDKVKDMLFEISTAESKVSFELYSSMSLPTDFSVHLDYFDSFARNTPSTIGRHLAEALKEFGLISHSVWTTDGLHET